MSWLRTCLQKPFKACSAVLTELRLLIMLKALWGREPVHRTKSPQMYRTTQVTPWSRQVSLEMPENVCSNTRVCYTYVDPLPCYDQNNAKDCKCAQAVQRAVGDPSRDISTHVIYVSYVECMP
jgi:hypothetical protein